MTDERSPLEEVGRPLHDFSSCGTTNWTANNFFDISAKAADLDTTNFDLPIKDEFLKNISDYQQAVPNNTFNINVPAISVTAVPVQPAIDTFANFQFNDFDFSPSDNNQENGEAETSGSEIDDEDERETEESQDASDERVQAENEVNILDLNSQFDALFERSAELEQIQQGQQQHSLSINMEADEEDDDDANLPGFVSPASCFAPEGRDGPAYTPIPQDRPRSFYQAKRSNSSSWNDTKKMCHSHTFPFHRAQQKAWRKKQREAEYMRQLEEEDRRLKQKQSSDDFTNNRFIYQKTPDGRTLDENDTPYRMDSILKGLPALDRLAILLAESQPKEIAQYQRKDWTEDEMVIETPFCGTLSIISHVGAFVWFGVLVWQLNVRDQIEARKWQTVGNGWYRQRVDTGEEFDNTLLILAGFFLGLSYLTILMEGLASYAENYLRNFLNFQEAREYMDHERRVVPRIIWSLECYVTERPVQTYTRLEDGHTITNNFGHRLQKQKVSFELPVRRCVDVSGDIKAYHPGAVTRVEFEKTFGFINQNSALQYERLKREFLAKYPHRPKDAKLEEKLEIAGYRDRITVFFEADGRQQCMRKRYFWMFTFLLLGWPYRWWFRSATEKCRFTLVKLIELSDEDFVPP